MSVWTDEMKRAAMADAATVCKQAERIAELEAALRPFADLTTRASIDGTTTTVRVRLSDVERARKAIKG